MGRLYFTPPFRQQSHYIEGISETTVRGESNQVVQVSDCMAGRDCCYSHTVLSKTWTVLLNYGAVYFAYSSVPKLEFSAVVRTAKGSTCPPSLPRHIHRRERVNFLMLAFKCLLHTAPMAA